MALFSKTWIYTQKSASKCSRMCIWKTAFKGINKICNIHFYYTWKQLTWNIILCTFKCIQYYQFSCLNTLNTFEIVMSGHRIVTGAAETLPWLTTPVFWHQRLFVPLPECFTDDRCCLSGCSGCSVISWQAVYKSLSNYPFTTVALGDLFTL